MAQASSKRGMEKPPPTGGGATREKVERQVMPSAFPYVLCDGTKITLHKLTLDQSDELGLDFGGLRGEDGNIDGQAVARLASRSCRGIAAAATGKTPEEVGKMNLTDVLGIAGAILKVDLAESEQVADFFEAVAGILLPILGMQAQLAAMRTSAS